MKGSLIGKMLILTGLVVSLNPFFILFFGAPLIIIGEILLWTKETERKSIILWSLAPILAPFIILFILWVSTEIRIELSQKIDYIIQEDFFGTITIIESKCGDQPNIKNNRLQFEIPKNGVYLFDGELEGGYRNDRYFIRSKNGVLEEIQLKHWRTKKEDKDTTGQEIVIGILDGQWGQYGRNNFPFIQKIVETNKIYPRKSEIGLTQDQENIIKGCETTEPNRK
jgi:hypothetical protein